MGDDKKLHDIEAMDFVNIQSSRRRTSTDSQEDDAQSDDDLVSKLVAEAPVEVEKPKKPKKSKKAKKKKSEKRVPASKAVAKEIAPKAATIVANPVVEAAPVPAPQKPKMVEVESIPVSDIPVDEVAQSNNIFLTMPDGAKREYPVGITGAEVASDISKSLGKAAFACAIGSRTV